MLEIGEMIHFWVTMIRLLHSAVISTLAGVGYDHFSARTRQQQMTYEQQCIHTSNWHCCIKAAACVSIKAKMQFSILVTLAHWDSKKCERLDFIQKSEQSKDCCWVVNAGMVTPSRIFSLDNEELFEDISTV